MDESIERIEVPEVTAPPSIADIRAMIMEMGLATSDEVQAIAGRLEKVETIVADLPTLYASTASLDKVKTSQAGYESGLRQLTGQVARLTDITTDSQTKFTTIDTRLADLTGTMKTMTGNLTTFMDTQRAAVANQQTTVTEVKAETAALAKKVTFVETTQADAERRYNESHNPLRDYVLGSETQEGLKATFGRVFTEVHELRASVSQQSAEHAIALDYVKSQKAKEESYVSFRQRIYLQMFTKTGFALVVGSIFLLIVLAQSIDLERSFIWLRNAAALFGVKVG